MDVCEDSVWARRIAKWTGFDANEIQAILRSVHSQRGHGKLRNWLNLMGYEGAPVQVVYTSDLERELEVGLCILERLLNTRFQSQRRDMAKVALMYTSIWDAGEWTVTMGYSDCLVQ